MTVEMDLNCRICGNKKDNKIFLIREMMYGTREPFEYFQCADCKCLQIRDIPKDLSKYYPEQYWPPANDSKRFFETALKKIIHRSLMLLPNVFHQLAYYVLRFYRAPVWSGWNWIKDFKSFGIRTDSAFLDVGCGNGTLLFFLKRFGYNNLYGVEPFLSKNLSREGITVFNQELKKVKGTYDFITLHHSFEHVQDPLSFFFDLHRLLNPNRYLLLRIPVATSYAWEHYREHWVQADAPRHLFLHTPSSIKLLCEKVGFRVSAIRYDSNDFQFWGSEQYSNDIPMNASEYLEFSAQTLKSFKKRSKVLNQQQKGDQACFYLQKS